MSDEPLTESLALLVDDYGWADVFAALAHLVESYVNDDADMNPLGIHCAVCTVVAPCVDCAQQVAAEARYRRESSDE